MNREKMTSEPGDRLPAQLSNFKEISLETYKRNGEAVRTPVWFVEDEGGLLFISTRTNTGKVKRLRGNSRVRLAPSDFAGHPKGKWLAGQASVVESESGVERVKQLMRKKYGLMRAVLGIQEKLMGTKRIIYSILLDDPDSGERSGPTTSQ